MENAMSTTWNIHKRCGLSRVLHLFVWCALLAGVAHGQVEQSQPDKLAYGAGRANLSDAIDKVKHGNFALVDIELIAEAGAVRAIPALKEQFVRSQNSLTKAKIADALVRLGDKDATYWNFLAEQAALAVESPDPRLADSQGKIVPEQFSPEFIAWSKAHNVSSDPVYGIPVLVILLAETGDPRGIPLLRRGLLSPNYFVVAAAAKGLAQIQDKASIPLMIDACKRAPEAALAIAESLGYFDDPRAQSAVDTYLPKDIAKALREARAQGKKPFGRLLNP
jgi:hypothetical protein